MKSLFDLLVMPMSIFNNVLLDFIALGLVGVIAYKLAYFIIGETDLREIFGSIGHWAIRFFIYCAICYLIKIVITIYNFIVSVPLEHYIALGLFATMIYAIKYSIENKNSVLNKKII